MSVKRGNPMRVLVLVFILMAIAGVIAVTYQWKRTPPLTAPYHNAAKSMPVLTELAQEQVTFLRVQDWCQAYADNRAKRTSDLRGTCAYGTGFQLFDAASQTRYRKLKGLLKDLPYGVQSIDISYRPNGGIRTASLTVDTVNPSKRYFLIYEPGYTLPPDIPGERTNHPIDADWLYASEDWN